MPAGVEERLLALRQLVLAGGRARLGPVAGEAGGGEVVGVVWVGGRVCALAPGTRLRGPRYRVVHGQGPHASIRHYSQRPRARSRTSRRTGGVIGMGRLRDGRAGLLAPFVEPLAGRLGHLPLQSYELAPLGAAQPVLALQLLVERLQPAGLSRADTIRAGGIARCR